MMIRSNKFDRGRGSVNYGIANYNLGINYNFFFFFLKETSAFVLCYSLYRLSYRGKFNSIHSSDGISIRHKKDIP